MHAAEGGVKMERCAVALQTVCTGNMGLMDSIMDLHNIMIRPAQKDSYKS